MSPVELLHADATPRARHDHSFQNRTVGVAAYAHMDADLALLEQLRRDPGPLEGRNLPASFLRHADEQSVCGFAAVVKAIRDFEISIADLAEWGVLAATRFFGRLQSGATIARFFDQGVRGVSPHVIPQNSQHSLSGIVSVGLGIGGANFGVGGGPESLADGLLTAIALLAEGRLPGVWLVATEWDCEPTLHKNGRAVAEGRCHAVAMALQRSEQRAAVGVLEMSHERSLGDSNASDETNGAKPSVRSLAEALERCHQARHPVAPWSITLDWGARISLGPIRIS